MCPPVYWTPCLPALPRAPILRIRSRTSMVAPHAMITAHFVHARLLCLCQNANFCGRETQRAYFAVQHCRRAFPHVDRHCTHQSARVQVLCACQCFSPAVFLRLYTPFCTGIVRGGQCPSGSPWRSGFRFCVGATELALKCRASRAKAGARARFEVRVCVFPCAPAHHRCYRFV